jgi:hypothetical protein
VELFAQSGYILGYFIQTFGYLVVAMLLSIVIRNTGVVIGIMSIYSLFLERVLSLTVPEDFRDFFPLASMDKLVTLPFTLTGTADDPVLPPAYLICALLYIGLFSGLGYYILHRRDL